MDEEDILKEIQADLDGKPESAATPRVAKASRKGTAPSGGGIASWIKILAVVVFLGGGVTVLLWGTGASDAFVYSKLVDEVMSDQESFVGRELRVEGQLRQGSVVFSSEPTCEHTFVLTRNDQEMPVRFPRCVVPDTFRDDMNVDVVVQGQLQANGTFLADQVIPRCPSKYEMREREGNGEAAPHTAVPVEAT